MSSLRRHTGFGRFSGIPLAQAEKFVMLRTFQQGNSTFPRRFPIIYLANLLLHSPISIMPLFTEPITGSDFSITSVGTIPLALSSRGAALHSFQPESPSDKR